MSIDCAVIELIDVCNLNCSYCLRDDNALHGRPHALPISDLTRILGELKRLTQRCEIQFTGGEPTLHPEFPLALRAVHDAGFRFAVITNGWNFTRVLPAVLEYRDSLDAILFSIDGITRAEHDSFRGKGSFERVMRAVVACRQSDLPFYFKVKIDRHRSSAVRDYANFAARLGARQLQFSPLLPANAGAVQDVMGIEEQREFLREVNQLRSILRLPIELSAGFYDPHPAPTCGVLLKRIINIDYQGRLVLCTILAGFRGQAEDNDVIADLRKVPLSAALTELGRAVDERNHHRVAAFAALGEAALRPPMRLGANCFDCLCSLNKMPQGPFGLGPENIFMDDHLSFTVSDSIIASDFDGKEGLLLDTSTQRYHTLNETATFLWQEIERGRSVSEMTASLCAAFVVDAEQARASVVAVLTRLESQSLVTRAAAAPPPLVSAGEQVRS